MNNNDVVKNALAVAAAKAGHKDVKDFLKTKGVEVTTPSEKVSESKKDKYCDRTCQGVVQGAATPAPEKEEKKRLTPIWPLPDDQTIEQYRAQLDAERAATAKKREAFLKEIDSPENLARVRAAAIEAASKLPSKHIPSDVASKKKEDKEEKREAKAKAKTEKKEKGRQNRLGQTKLIDDLIKVGKTEKEIFDAVREKIPAYPADKLPKLIKLRQYHVKK